VITGHWGPETQEVFDAPIPAELFDVVKLWSVELDAGERVERVCVATRPRIVLLIMTTTHLHIVTGHGNVQMCHGIHRNTLSGRADGDTLIVSRSRYMPEDTYRDVMPTGAAQTMARELHKPFSMADLRRRQAPSPSIAELRW
jgi:hypothetical protein